MTYDVIFRGIESVFSRCSVKIVALTLVLGRKDENVLESVVGLVCGQIGTLAPETRAAQVFPFYEIVGGIHSDKAAANRHYPFGMLLAPEHLGIAEFVVSHTAVVLSAENLAVYRKILTVIAVRQYLSLCAALVGSLRLGQYGNYTFASVCVEKSAGVVFIVNGTSREHHLVILSAHRLIRGYRNGLFRPMHEIGTRRVSPAHIAPAVIRLTVPLIVIVLIVHMIRAVDVQQSVRVVVPTP